jgi:uncharacterized protein with LGFP repeats
MLDWASGARIAPLLALSACASTDCENHPDCTNADSHCDGATAYVCEPTEVTWGSAAHLQGHVCASADLCKVDAVGAFCTAETTPNPNCAQNAWCENNTDWACRSGYVIFRQACLVCATSSDDCPGRLGWPCTKSSECASGLQCLPDGAEVERTCTQPCDCPPGEDCPSCAAFFAGYGGTVCDAGLCEIAAY